MLRHRHDKIVLRLSIVLVGTALSLPAFGHAGFPYSGDHARNPNAQNAAKTYTVVPSVATRTAVGYGQPAIPAEGSGVAIASGSSSRVANPARDTDTTAKIKHAIFTDAVTSGNDIHVTTVNGMVTLTGEVRVDQEALEATEIAQTAPGVREVVNQLVVTSKHRGKAELSLSSNPDWRA